MKLSTSLLGLALVAVSGFAMAAPATAPAAAAAPTAKAAAPAKATTKAHRKHHRGAKKVAAVKSAATK